MSTIQRVIAVTSCKGGVGKSTVSLALARRLARRGARVGLYDADVHGPSLPTQLPRAGPVAPTADGWAMVPQTHEGLALMSFGLIEQLWGSGDEIDPRGAGTAGELAVQLLHTTAWGALDYVVIDTPPGTGEVPRALAARAELAGAVVVTTPSDLAVADVVRGAAMLRKFGVPILGVVENMATFRCGCGEVHRPFGTGGLDAVLEAAGGGAPSFSLPINDARLDPHLDGLVDVLEGSPARPAAFPALDWHEKPHWPDKLYFAGRGGARRHRIDSKFAITPPRREVL
mmetsp:Transcript_5598/g.16486  ORF Transcript_5598/g.16486 Transcript_5598/m.16486 type:complete len:286 (+) Transcript_5598:165-1022(+)